MFTFVAIFLNKECEGLVFSLTTNARNKGESKGYVEYLGNGPTSCSEVWLFRVPLIRDIRDEAVPFRVPSLLKEKCLLLSDK